ncbi:MAG: type II toxin-antitoxin system RelE/ParE family toxin [Clostridiales bacterium]|jgi:addiction module RelE/StbE family toxin|nr:type II toxin-antitoxin system RelE/ParE family toxin [Clostridiales bacterium]
MSSKYTLKMTPQAERDLDGIYKYIADELQNGKAAADLIDMIENALIGLENMPLKCPESDIPELKRDGYRKCIVKKYIALYTVDAELKTVTVVKVFYGMRDYKNLGLY